MNGNVKAVANGAEADAEHDDSDEDKDEEVAAEAGVPGGGRSRTT